MSPEGYGTFATLASDPVGLVLCRACVSARVFFNPPALVLVSISSVLRGYPLLGDIWVAGAWIAFDTGPVVSENEK